MALSQNSTGQVVLELNAEEVEKYVKAGIDRRLDELFLHHRRLSLDEIIRRKLMEMLEQSKLHSHIAAATHSWLDARRGWLSSIIVRGHNRKTPSIREWTDKLPTSVQELAETQARSSGDSISADGKTWVDPSGTPHDLF